MHTEKPSPLRIVFCIKLYDIIKFKLNTIHYTATHLKPIVQQTLTHLFLFLFFKRPTAF